MSAHADRSCGQTPGKALEAHVAECDPCRDLPPPIERIAMLLNAGVVPIDAGALSRRTLLRLQPELVRLGGTLLWRKAVAALLLALVPLPAVLTYDAYVLRGAYALVSALLPATLAAYLIFSYAAFLVLLFATTYAAIPVLLANPPSARRPALG